MVTRVICVLDDFSSSVFSSVWGRCPAERGEQTLRCAQPSARLSVEHCRPDWRRFHTTPRCTESVHFLWPWIERFQDSWWDPEFHQLSQMVQSLPGFLDLCLNVCSPSQVLGDVYNPRYLKLLTLSTGRCPQMYKYIYWCYWTHLQWCSWIIGCFGFFNIIHPHPGDPAEADQTPACVQLANLATLPPWISSLEL